MLETKRLILRRWEEGDAEDLYKFAICRGIIFQQMRWFYHILDIFT